MPKLTKTVIEAAAGADVFLWDTEVPGFGARIQRGRRSYVVRYRSPSGVQRKLKLARYCDVTPDKARDMARRVFAQVAAGEDPAAQRRASRVAASMEQLSVRYMAEHARPFKKKRSADGDEALWRLHVLPRFGRATKVADVDRAAVLKVLGEMKATPGAANAVLALLSKAFNLAEEWGWRAQNTNPCRRLKKYRLAPRSLILTREQIAAVDRACTELVAEGDITPAMAALTRLWLITGCRNAEIRTAERAWVNFETKTLLLPDSKVGHRAIPLPDAALEVIRALPDTGRWLIPGRVHGQPLKSPWGAWKRIAARAGVPPDATPHTLRHTVGSVGHRVARLSQKQIAMQLGHEQLSTTEIYIHGEHSERFEVATRVADAMTAGWQSRQQPAAAAT